ncbi:SMI1/KNR4 family protein [Actinomadura chibensis]|uniref:SMI1/KNR4 family protein n=1 Tax=Actinomadura chibensis TaxID=392828 RepID=A0A5D0NS29_9ACTN|nr:SMI1/KNR4 family protein [Actinomadura chibensis]TYB46901.1 SMI1/KNR4 family protein [Actinomadura chibensis]
MRPSTRQRLERVSSLLAAREDSYMFAEFPPGAPESDLAGRDDLPPDLRDLLAYSNAPRAGSIALFKDTLLPNNQFYLDMPGVDEIIGGSRESWLVFGTCFDFPLLMHRDDGAVWHFPDYEREHVVESEYRRLAADLDEFVVDCMLGPRYREITGVSDWWWEFAVENGLAEN